MVIKHELLFTEIISAVIVWSLSMKLIESDNEDLSHKQVARCQSSLLWSLWLVYKWSVYMPFILHGNVLESYIEIFLTVTIFISVSPFCGKITHMHNLIGVSVWLMVSESFMQDWLFLLFLYFSLHKYVEWNCVVDQRQLIYIRLQTEEKVRPGKRCIHQFFYLC